MVGRMFIYGVKFGLKLVQLSYTSFTILKLIFKSKCGYVLYFILKKNIEYTTKEYTNGTYNQKK